MTVLPYPCPCVPGRVHQHLFDHAEHDRHHAFGIEGWLHRAPPRQPVRQREQNRHGAFEIDVAANFAPFRRTAQQSHKLLADVRLPVLVDARHGRIAAALRHDLGTERNLLHAALDQVMLRQRGEAFEEVALADRRELLRGLGALALRDAGDDVFLGAEVAVEVARAHAGLRADLLHRGLVEPRPRKAGLRRREDFVAAVGLQLDVGAAHEIVPCDKIERTFIRQ